MPDLSEIEIGLMGPPVRPGYQVRPHQAHKEAQQLSQAPRLVYISKCFLGLMLKYTKYLYILVQYICFFEQTAYILYVTFYNQSVVDPDQE
jgi:hypothetical protein